MVSAQDSRFFKSCCRVIWSWKVLISRYSRQIGGPERLPNLVDRWYNRGKGEGRELSPGEHQSLRLLSLSNSHLRLHAWLLLVRKFCSQEWMGPVMPYWCNLWSNFLLQCQRPEKSRIAILLFVVLKRSFMRLPAVDRNSQSEIHGLGWLRFCCFLWLRRWRHTCSKMRTEVREMGKARCRSPFLNAAQIFAVSQSEGQGTSVQWSLVDQAQSWVCARLKDCIWNAVWSWGFKVTEEPIPWDEILIGWIGGALVALVLGGGLSLSGRKLT